MTNSTAPTLHVHKDDIVTMPEIEQGLRELGLRDFEAIIVHASLSSLGWVCGGQQAVVQALLAAAGPDVTVVLPTFSGDWTDPAGWRAPAIPSSALALIRASLPPFDPALTPTRGMGAIAECFRTHPESKRSLHPQVSFTAVGRHATSITAQHSLGNRFGEISPLGALDRLNSAILFLGTDFIKCTAFHLAEYRISYPGRKEIERLIPSQGASGTVWNCVQDIALIEDDFPEIGRYCRESIPHASATIGRADSILISFKTVVRTAQSIMSQRTVANPMIVR